ncbi:hypothetical protein KEH51_02065 [[Brevibacterium] frigoritolerans]|uniref:Uncharacterized protein n=1 Tax=Peribacillus frigoritolerans TaxID=450367 RepID=A0A941FID9_9BACI|nr:hypothetical protein [Peribacillus frigoritolerans]
MNMLKQEWKLFLTNRKLVGVAIVLLFVLIIYGGYSLVPLESIRKNRQIARCSRE